MFSFTTRDPDLILDEILQAEADLHDRTVYKSRFERQDLRAYIVRLQACLREALAQSQAICKLHSL